MKKGSFSKEFGIYFWIHLSLIFCYYLSPFIFNYKLTIIISMVIIVQYLLFNDCIITKAEFKEHSKQTGFFKHYLSKIGINLEKKTIDTISYFVPVILIAISLIWQVYLNHKPLLF